MVQAKSDFCVSVVQCKIFESDSEMVNHRY